jgi:hypothetical protein
MTEALYNSRGLLQELLLPKEIAIRDFLLAHDSMLCDLENARVVNKSARPLEVQASECS